MTTVQNSFSTIYADKTYQNPATVRHNATVIAFAMDQQRKIYYTVLDINTPDAKPSDAENWLKEPKELLFANEITQVGYGGFDLTTLPIMKKNGEVVIPGTRMQPQELDSFQSSTARLTAKRPVSGHVRRSVSLCASASEMQTAPKSPMRMGKRCLWSIRPCCSIALSCLERICNPN